MREQTAEAIIGAIVLAVALAFVWFTSSQVSLAGDKSAYELKARFDRVDGLSIGSDVRLSGVKVGVVRAIELDTKSYLATVRLSVRKDVGVPDDSVAKLTSEGLLGAIYLSLDPGSSETMLPAGGEVEYTRGSVDILTLFAQMMRQPDNPADAETSAGNGLSKGP